MSARAELILTFKDAGTVAGLNKVGETADKVARKSAAAADKMYKSHVAAERYSLAAVEHFERQHEQLKIRSERTIRAEISQTQQAYKNLAASGLYSAKELSRAYDAQIKRVRDLRNEMGELTKTQKAMATLPFVAGAGAAAYTLKSPAQAAMSFDERLANMSNTAFSGRDLAGRRAGMKQLESAINKSVGKGGGGTREQAAEALDMLIASGAVSSTNAINLLPTLMRASTASGASAVELAQIGIRAQQTFGIKPGEMGNVLNMALAAGQAGGFELRDMARWLPQQMAAATMSGMSGRAGFAKLAALNQASAITAGSKDEAGNNVVNLLAKINSSDTAKDAEKLGINLPEYLQAQRKRGLDSVDAFAALVDKTVSGRADYQALKKQLGSAKNDGEKRATLESMATIAQGAGIGKLVQDRQAMMALLALMNNRQYMDDVLTKVKASDVPTGGAIDKNYALMSETASFRVRQADQAKDAASKSAMDALTPAIGKAAEAFSDLATKHPTLAGATVLATAAVTAFATATGLATLAMGGKIPGAGAAVNAIKGWLPRIAIGGAGLTSTAVGGVLASGAAGYVAGTVLNYGISKGLSAITGQDATLGTVLYDLINSSGSLKKEPPKMDAKMTVALAPGLVLQSQSMQTGGPVNAWLNTGSIWGTP